MGYKTGTITEFVHETMQPSHGTYQADFVYATVPAITMFYKEEDKKSTGTRAMSRTTLLKMAVACLSVAAFVSGV